ncbi:Ser/Thr protein phosphatase, putative [Trichomonas vaginalis G3]|uniref:Serine/threonine-protein phosphatase n=1 Tax=Trichomonas vaginalis (strain ATCC PRA-98 / G3) TaxID=412133 RepID=A2END8_TRIV3|nr:serine threonine-protein phosphatase family [Trichomonas vaginalis G3]EAY05808.1 Ser/Thr protein phosphatase, putative [Trichomonas vaginalis G3]KAI5516348.1 serine threonine-protein phosphatase family [Trichomonas vaginalis G3]|eukprot:XP_001318031.1 Ser/Thr protein phosphatase [Trichomonas vaginalis G3]
MTAIEEVANRVIENASKGLHLDLEDCFSILDSVEKIFSDEQNIIDIAPPVLAIADMHGQLFDMLKIFEICKESSKFLFLGDYVDRGPYSVELFIYLAAKKILQPNNYYLIRGNHEDSGVNSTYGLFEDCKQIYRSNSLYLRMNEVFLSLPIAAIIGNKIFCVHGGLGPTSETIEKINDVYRYQDIDQNKTLTDITWSDPDFISQKFIENSRGAGHIMGKTAVLEFLNNNKFNLILRAHQTQDLGYRFYFDSKLLSLWSAPLYYGTQSKAKVLNINEDLSHELIAIEPAEKRTRTDEILLDYFKY